MTIDELIEQLKALPKDVRTPTRGRETGRGIPSRAVGPYLSGEGPRIQ